MTRDQFDALVRQLDTEAKAAPKNFTLRVGTFAAFGYAYMLGVLLVMVAATLLIVLLVIRFPNGATIKLGLFAGLACGGMALAILKALWIRLPPPDGLVLKPADAPELHALVDEVRRQLDSEPFHEIQLVPEFNASVVQIPRLGVFGWHRNYLRIGLPLLQALAPDEFKAVLAHEFGHLSRSHGRFGNWLYRLRRTWDRVFDELARHQPGKLALLLTSFIKWFWPRFNARAFVLSRVNEYEADAAAARIAGAGAIAGALQRLQVQSKLLDDEFWHSVSLRANREPTPPANVFADCAALIRQGLNPAETAKQLRTGFLLETNNGDTHPCLKDRLRALQCLPENLDAGRFPTELPPLPEKTAADAFLGAQLPALTQRLSEDWAKAVEPIWVNQHKEAAELAAKLDTLTQRPDGPPPLPAELWERAQVIFRLEGDRKAVPLLEQILKLDPAHAGANFVCGRDLLAADDPRGVEFIEKALLADPSLTSDGCGLLHGHYQRTGQRAKLRGLEERMDAFQEVQAAAQHERNNVTAIDTFLPPELPAAEIARLAALFAGERSVSAVHVARKQVQHFPDSPCFVVALTLDVAWWKPTASDAGQKLVNKFINDVNLPGHFLMFIVEKELKSLGRAVAAVPGSAVYQRVEG